MSPAPVRRPRQERSNRASAPGSGTARRRPARVRPGPGSSCWSRRGIPPPLGGANGDDGGFSVTVWPRSTCDVFKQVNLKSTWTSTVEPTGLAPLSMVGIPATTKSPTAGTRSAKAMPEATSTPVRASRIHQRTARTCPPGAPLSKRRRARTRGAGRLMPAAHAWNGSPVPGGACMRPLSVPPAGRTNEPEACECDQPDDDPGDRHKEHRVTDTSAGGRLIARGSRSDRGPPSTVGPPRDRCQPGGSGARRLSSSSRPPGSISAGAIGVPSTMSDAAMCESSASTTSIA